ncbi:hypothetical protein [Candidatus Nitrospira bockiana]
MRISKFMAATGGLLALALLSLWMSNPSRSSYRQHVLAPIAEQETHRTAEIERRSIEREAAAIEAHLAAVHYEGSRLEAAAMARHYPLLGSKLARQADGQSLTERLAQIKAEAVQQVAVTREALQYAALTDLDARTTRTSYGLWSFYSTCRDKVALAFWGVAGRFYEATPTPCPAAAP